MPNEPPIGAERISYRRFGVHSDAGALRRLTDSGGHYAADMSFAGYESALTIRGLGLEPEPVRITARCTTSWSLVT